MTQEFVTLPREVVEQAIDALYCTDSEEGSPAYNFELKAIEELRAALEQPQNHIPGVRNMVPTGWKLVPVEPTVEMMDAGGAATRRCYQHLNKGEVMCSYVYRHMLDAAPQPPTTDQSSAVQQPQGEQEPVAWIRTEWSSRNVTFDGPPAVPSVRDELTKPAWTPLYTRPQRERQPLSTARIDELIEEGIFGGNPYELVRRLEEERGVFMTRPLTDEVIKDIHGAIKWHEFGSGLAFARAIEAAHNIK